MGEEEEGEGKRWEEKKRRIGRGRRKRKIPLDVMGAVPAPREILK